MQTLQAYPIARSRRGHERVDLSAQHLEARLLLKAAGPARASYSVCRLLNLSYAGMCLQGEELIEPDELYRYVLGLSPLLGAEVEVAARIVWKRSMGVGLCYAGAVFLKSSAPWLGPDEEDDDPQYSAGLGRD